MTVLPLALCGTSALSVGLQAPPGIYSAIISDWLQGKTGTVPLEDLASGTVDAQGRFSIVLPELATSERLRKQLARTSGLFTDQPDLNVPADQNCKGQGKATPATSLGNEFFLFATVEGGAIEGSPCHAGPQGAVTLSTREGPGTAS